MIIEKYGTVSVLNGVVNLKEKIVGRIIIINNKIRIEGLLNSLKKRILYFIGL